MLPTFQQMRPSSLQGSPSLKEHHQGEQTQPLFCYQTPLMMELATNEIKDNSMLKSTAAIQANKHQIKQAVMTLTGQGQPLSRDWIWWSEEEDIWLSQSTTLWMLPSKLGSSKLALSPPKTKKEKEVTEDDSLLPRNNLPGKKKKERILWLILKLRGCVQIPFYSHFPFVSCQLIQGTELLFLNPGLSLINSSVPDSLLPQNWCHGRGGFLVRPQCLSCTN